MPFGKDKTTIAYILSATQHIMNTTDLRRRNLRQWIADKYGGQQTRFAEAIAINQGELSALLKNKSFGEKKAANRTGGANARHVAGSRTRLSPT